VASNTFKYRTPLHFKGLTTNHILPHLQQDIRAVNVGGIYKPVDVGGPWNDWS